MDTLEELIYYCKVEKPAGALLLGGEWGCGKTYMIDHTLKDGLSDTHIIIRISLFGISSIEALHNEVKKAWFLAWSESKGISAENSRKVKKVGKYLKTATSALGGLIPALKDISDGTFSINAMDFIQIKTFIDIKKVVLVFDDFERASLDHGCLLGCINDY